MSGPYPEGGEPGDLVTVGNFVDPIAAEFARSRLEADGLAVYIQGIGLCSLLPTATMYPIRLQVGAADAARAAEILGEVPESGLVRDDEDPEDGDQPGSGAES